MARPPLKAQEPLGTLATLALVAGAVALGAYALDLHAHTCEGCGARWRHLGAFNLGDPSAHTCRTCGTVQWMKDGVPHVFRSVLRTPPRAILHTPQEARGDSSQALLSRTSSTPPPSSMYRWPSFLEGDR
jgi:hypothetical protein